MTYAQDQMNTMKVPWADFASLWVLTPLTAKRQDKTTHLTAELRVYRQYALPAFADAVFTHCEPIARVLEDVFFKPKSWDSFNKRFFKDTKEDGRAVLPFRDVETRPLLHALWARSPEQEGISQLWPDDETRPEEMFCVLGAPTLLEYGRILCREEVASVGST